MKDCISYLSWCYDEVLDTSNFKKEGFSLTRGSRVQSIVAGRCCDRDMKQLLTLTAVRKKTHGILLSADPLSTLSPFLSLEP